MKWWHFLAVLCCLVLILTIQATTTDAERQSKIHVHLRVYRALKIGHCNTRLHFTEGVKQVLHLKFKKVKSIAKETGHIRTICQAKLNILGSTLTGTQEMNICFTSIIYSTLQYSNDF